MVDFFEALHKYMRENAKLKAKVEDRIYPLILPQNPKLPSIVYTPLSTVYDKNLQSESGFIRQSVQFSVHDTSFGRARQTSRLLRNIFKDFNGNMNGINIGATHCINDTAGSLGTQTQYSTEEYVSIVEYEFHYLNN